MSKLQQRKRTNLRWKSNDGVLELYQPTPEQEQELLEIINSNVTIDVENGEANGEFGEQIIRFVLRSCTNLGAESDEYSYDEMVTKFDIDDLLGKIQILIEELTNKVIEAQIGQLKAINQMFKLIELGEMNDSAIIKMNKLMKKSGVNVTVEDMVKHKDNPDEITKLIEQSKKNFNKKGKK